MALPGSHGDCADVVAKKVQTYDGAYDVTFEDDTGEAADFDEDGWRFAAASIRAGRIAQPLRLTVEFAEDALAQ